MSGTVYIVLEDRDPIYADKNKQRCVDYANEQLRKDVIEEGYDVDDIVQRDGSINTSITHPYTEKKYWIEHCQYHEENL